MEWCLKDASQLRVTRIERIELSSANGVELAATAGPRMATGGVEADGKGGDIVVDTLTRAGPAANAAKPTTTTSALAPAAASLNA